VSPGIPVIDVGIGSAERGRFDADDGVVGAGCWVLAFGVREAGLGGSFDERTHRSIITRRREMPSQGVKAAASAARWCASPSGAGSCAGP
jgi:hypothetical protein